MTTVAPTGQGTGAPAPDPYRSALAYLLALVRGEASLNEHKAIASTAVCESHRRGLTDSRRSWSGEATSPSTPPSSPWMRHDLPSLRSHRSTRLARTRRRRVTTATSPGRASVPRTVPNAANTSRATRQATYTTAQKAASTQKRFLASYEPPTVIPGDALTPTQWPFPLPVRPNHRSRRHDQGEGGHFSPNKICQHSCRLHLSPAPRFPVRVSFLGGAGTSAAPR
jgi:hypothetical protein